MQLTHHPLCATTLALSAALLAPLAHATNGYFSHGYGAKSQGIAGVGIALPQDALAAASNPAGTAAVGTRLDLGATLFAPRRSADIEGNAFGPDASYSGDGRKLFLIPDFGYTRALDARTSVGLAVYGNGGMNTGYDNNPYGRFGATGTAGVNLEQLFISPSVAHKLDEVHTLGAALNIAYQRFDARGIGLFSGFSAAPANVSDQGKDSDVGVGLRLGWTGQLTPQLRLGGTWASKVQGRFDKYRGLFADGGGFDIPENYGVGIAYAATHATTLAGDIQHIRYGDVTTVGNSAARLFAGQPLGSNNGPGFGWRNLTVLKLGVQHQVNAALTVRAGFSVANQPVPRSETFFNVLAPGVIRQHLTLGATWKLASGGELSGFYALGLGKTVRGAGSIPPGFPPAGLGGGNANVRLKEHILGVSYGWTF